MDEGKFKKYLEERYRDQINWYDKKSLDNQKIYKKFQFILIILSSLTPVLIVIEFCQPANWLLKWSPVLTSVIVAILTSVLKSFKYQENWITYRTTCETLKKEYYYYEAGINEYGEVEDKEALFVERVERLISRENTLWVESCKEDKKSEN
ncbi:DUF4231 domain-containing protein [Methanosarcina sp. Mfa9]|uniref:DUF4231 domain-containing protein n=1 Tax=Methanosarcina sp. Mfa9 TaxID=3439063 RepID=UPI003F872174